MVAVSRIVWWLRNAETGLLQSSVVYVLNVILDGDVTKAELIADARAVGVTMTARAITDWIEQGLLDAPRRQGAGRGRGSRPGAFPPNQRQLFRQLIQHRNAGARIPTLARLPLYLWAYWGEDYVPLRQAKRALRTALGPAPSLEQATQAARQMVDQLADSDAEPDARDRLVRLAAKIAYNGRVDDRAKFTQYLQKVFDPHQQGRTLGVPGAQTSATTVLSGMLRREAARAVFLRGEVPNQTLSQVRIELLSSVREYYLLQPGFAAAAARGGSAIAFDLPSAQELVDRIVPHMLLIIGTLCRLVPLGDQR